MNVLFEIYGFLYQEEINEEFLSLCQINVVYVKCIYIYIYTKCIAQINV